MAGSSGPLLPLLGGVAEARRRTTLAGLALAGAVVCLALVALGMQQGPVEQLEVLAMGDAFDSRQESPNNIEYIGKIPVDDVFDYGLMDRPVCAPLCSHLYRGVLLLLHVSVAEFVRVDNCPGCGGGSRAVHH